MYTVLYMCTMLFVVYALCTVCTVQDSTNALPGQAVQVVLQNEKWKQNECQTQGLKSPIGDLRPWVWLSFLFLFFKTTRTAWPAWPSSDVLYINCTQNQFCSKQHSTHVQCTTEKFKSDDEVQISAEDKDIDAEVDI